MIQSIKANLSLRDMVKGLIFAIPFALMQLISSDLKSDNQMDMLKSGPVSLIYALLILLAAFLLSFILSSIGFMLVNKCRELISRSISVKKDPGFKYYRGRYFKALIGVLICYLPYYILFFPGTSNYGDTEKQLRMFFHRHVDFPLDVSPLKGPDVFISDHHPFFTTWLYGSFAKLGLFLTGHAFIGIALFSFVQLFLFAAILVYFWIRLSSLGLSDKIVKGGLIFTAIFPFYPIFFLCMVKDMTFSFFCLTTTLLLFEVMISDGLILEKWLFYPLLGLSLLFIILSKGQGKYLAVILLFVMLFLYKKKWKQILLTFIIPIMFYQFIWQGMLLPSWNISPAGKQETLGVLFQQTARYVTYYDSEVTAAEKEAIDAIIPYDTIADSYEPEKSDPVKWNFNQNATSTELKNYYKCWFSMLLKHPGVYFAATLNTSYRFFDITWQTSPIFVRFNSRVDKSDEIYIYSFFTDGQLGDTVKGLFSSLQRIPILGLIFSVPFYTWLAYFSFLSAIGKDQGKRAILTILPFLSVLIYFACPMSLARYSQPIIMMAPPMLFGILLPKNCISKNI